MLKFVFVACLVDLVAAGTYVGERTNKIKNCDLGTNIYRELGCKPIRSGGSSCPKSYECPKYEIKPHMCRHLGIYYKEQQMIRNTTLLNVDCKCQVDKDSGVGNIICGYIDYNPQPVNRTCYRKCHTLRLFYQYEIKCEPYGDIARCESDGFEYKEGEIFEPSGTCLRCLCKKGYDGIPKEPYCERRQCDLDLSNPEQLAKNCTPIYYYEHDRCCPYRFLCPEDVSGIHVVGGTPGGLECTLGQHKIPVGGKFESKDPGNGEEIVCSCDVPPWPNCYLKYGLGGKQS